MTNATWRWNIKRGLSNERKARVVQIARDIYAKRFGVPAPENFTERQTSNSAVLIFDLPQEEQATLPLFKLTGGYNAADNKRNTG